MMRAKLLPLLLAGFVVFTGWLAPLAVRADQTKSDNNASLQSGTSWVTRTAPGAGDNAVWDATVATAANCTNVLGAAASWGGIVIKNPATDVTITGSGTLTLANGIDLGAAAANLNLNCTIVTVGANQSWNVATGFTLITGSPATAGRVQNNIITKTGAGTWTTSGTDDNGGLGVKVNAGTVNLNKTSSSGKHAIGGGGLTVNTNGLVRLTGTGGDQIYDAANVTLNGGTFDLNGGSETISHLYVNSGTLLNAFNTPVLTASSGVVLQNTGGVIQVTGGTLTLPGAITGNYSWTKTGAGALILSGTNSNQGTTLVGAGELTGVTGGSMAGSALVVADGATNGVQLSSAATFWACGNLAYAWGTNCADFNFGTNVPDTAIAPLQVKGSLTISNVLRIIIRGSAIPTGVYPLITYTGAALGTVPATAFNLPSGVTATIVNDPADRSINLNVTAGNTAPLISWGAGDGIWDINTTANWQNADDRPAFFVNGDTVVLDDTAAGTSPITLTLNATVTPTAVQANNSAKDYVISGLGAIGGTNALVVQGLGALTLATTNTYSGGTTISSGRLNLNNGGNGSGNSAIGTGTFTINGGTLDNTGSADISLAPNNAQTWAGNFSYAGSVHNLNLGTGTVTVKTNLMLTVSNNTFITGGHVNGNKITKAGNGTWTISGGNSTDNSNLGIIINAGTVNLNKSDSGSHSIGGGGLVINNGGTARITGTGGDQIYDNSPVTLSAGGVLDLNGHNEAMAGVTGFAGALDNMAAGTHAALTILGTGSSTFAGTFQNSGTGAFLELIKAGTGGLILTGSNTYRGGTFISAGMLQAGAGTDVAALTSPLGAGPVTNNAMLVLGSSETVILANAISGSGTLVLSNGSAVLTGTNTYAGSTIIGAETWLQLTGHGSIAGSTNILLGGGATWDVSGLVSPLTLGSTQALTGNGPETEVVGDINLGAGALTLDYSTGTPVLMVSDGAWTFNNNPVRVVVSGSTPLGTGTYLLLVLDMTGALAGSVTASPVTVAGAGLVANTKAGLQLDDEGLWLVVAANTATMPTTLTLGGPANPLIHGAAAVFTADIIPAPPAGGTVVFQDGPVLLGTGRLTNGVAIFTTSELWFGSHNITAVYAGDGTYLPAAGNLRCFVTGILPADNATRASVAGGTMTMAYPGLSGYLYGVQRSTNLADWTTIAAAVRAADDGTVEFTDPAPPQPAAFYRLVWDSTYATVPATDVTLQPVPTDNLPVFAYITAYDVNEQTVTNATGAGEMPLYYPYDSCTTIGGNVVETPGNEAWWDNLLSEQLQARLPVVLLSTCGAYTTNATDLNGPGNINPRRLKYWLDAVKRAGATNMFQTCCFAEAAAQGIYQNYYGQSGALYDFSNPDAWNQVWWLRIIKPWFDTVPTNTWYHLNGGIPIECWGLNINSIYTNQQGNISRMVNFIATNMQATYGVTPRFIMGSLNCDTTLTNCPWMVGDNEWFDPPTAAYTMTPYKGYVWGGLVAGYINPAYYGSPTDPAYLNPNVVVARNGIAGTGHNGDSFQAGFDAAVNTNAIFTMIEGYTDVSESCGPYRSLSTNWDYPNQYLDILRSYTDLHTVTLRLDAEGCDEYANATGNPGGVYRRTGTLGIRALPGSGWAVTGTVAGEWIQFDNLQFSPGSYQFIVRYSATAAQALQLSVDGVAQPTVTVPATDGINVFNLACIGTNTLGFGTHTFKVLFVDGGVDVDWLFIKKNETVMNFRSHLNGAALTARSGGNDTLAATNALPAGNWEKFSVDDLAGNGQVTNGDSVNLQVYDGLYVTAVGGGGGQILARQRKPGGNELFTIVKLNGGGALAVGDQVAFRTQNGAYVTVQGDGIVDATSTIIGEGQTFDVVGVDHP